MTQECNFLIMNVTNQQLK